MTNELKSKNIQKQELSKTLNNSVKYEELYIITLNNCDFKLITKLTKLLFKTLVATDANTSIDWKKRT